jgi:hypothetical protein
MPTVLACSPTRNPLEDVTNHQQSTALSLWAEGSKEGDSDNQSIRENSIVFLRLSFKEQLMRRMMHLKLLILDHSL